MKKNNEEIEELINETGVELSIVQSLCLFLNYAIEGGWEIANSDIANLTLVLHRSAKRTSEKLNNLEDLFNI